MIYLHSHNGNRLEGFNLMEKFIKKNICFVLIDFRANGMSSGKYVTLGWLETIDINRVIKFLMKKVKA